MSHPPGPPGINAFLRAARTIAVVGASPDPMRSSHGVMRALQGAGYRCIPVNPKETEILGERCYKSLSDIPADITIDIVDVFRRAEYAPAIAREAVARGAKCLWLQMGIVNDDAMDIARAGGLHAVQDECLAVVVRTLT
ncbi:MAG: CoA-binding protein [Rhodospirillales bacterium]|nr:CoA-binding protein [Alphaproteobacteria bacterium]MCB9987304.1 CoA-binding protein [Rhodospirillales bacterium]USO07840.1 MAG: CoA-binding protein [Rhodospirillales bacterium]